MMRKILAVSTVIGQMLFALSNCSASESAIAPGTYFTDHAHSALQIQAQVGGEQKFEINADGANAHTCHLMGVIKNRTASLEGVNPAKPCLVKFIAVDDGIGVEDSRENCRSMYCGMRAVFTGVYRMPVKGCDSQSLRKPRALFKRRYDAKAYEEAQQILEPLLTTCQKTLSTVDEGMIRNDLALTQYKRHNFAGCIRTLAPWADYAARTDDEIWNSSPSAAVHFDIHATVIRAARTNLRLCNGGLHRTNQ